MLFRSGFTPDVRKKAGKQFMDVGIAEEHATALASGIAKNGPHHAFPLTGGFSYQSGTSLARGFPFPAHALCLRPHSSVTK